MPPRKSQITVTSRADSAKTRAVAMARNEALARRLSGGNVHGSAAKVLPLKEPQRWHTYIANTYLNEGAFYDMKQKGWEPLTPEDLNCKVEDSGFTLSPDGYLVRGPQGKEMVFKMDAEDYKLLEQAKTAANLRGIGSASKVRADMAEAASNSLGDEAASFVNSLDGKVIDTITGGDAS